MAKKKKIPFYEAVRDGLIPEGSKIDLSACYSDKNELVVLRPDETGYGDVQVFRRDNEDIEWTFHLDKNGVAILYGTPTKFELTLSGKRGFNNATDVLDNITGTWSNPSLGIKSRSAREEDVKNLIYECDRNEWAWLASPYVRTGTAYVHFGMCFVSLAGRVFSSNLFSSNGGVNTSSSAVRPVASILASDILVDLKSYKTDGVFKLLPPEKKN